MVNDPRIEFPHKCSCGARFASKAALIGHQMVRGSGHN
jgi:hypothetical protein